MSLVYIFCAILGALGVASALIALVVVLAAKQVDQAHLTIYNDQDPEETE